MNKHIEGLPYLAAVLDLSAGGMMVRKIAEPTLGRSFFAVELGIPWTDERFWLWSRCVREWGDRQALRFSGLTPAETTRLGELVHEVLKVG